MGKRYIEQASPKQYVKDSLIEMILNHEEFFSNLMEFESFYDDSPWGLKGTTEKKRNDIKQIYNEYINDLYKCVGITTNRLKSVRKCAGL